MISGCSSFEQLGVFERSMIGIAKQGIAIVGDIVVLAIDSIIIVIAVVILVIVTIIIAVVIVVVVEISH